MIIIVSYRQLLFKPKRSTVGIEINICVLVRQGSFCQFTWTYLVSHMDPSIKSIFIQKKRFPLSYNPFYGLITIFSIALYHLFYKLLLYTAPQMCIYSFSCCLHYNLKVGYGIFFFGLLKSYS